MTATDELRRMLDERGVEYDVDDTQVDGNGTMYQVTYVKEGYGRTWVYEEPPECDLLVSYNYDLGAEQAIEATLGRGTCHLEINTSMTAVVCDRCNYPMPCGTVLTEVRYCPNCGRQVVDS